MDLIKKTSFKQNIFISLISVSLIPLIICSFFLVKVYSITTKYQTEKDSASQVEMLTNKLTNLFEAQINASKSLLEDDLLSTVLIDSKFSDYSKDLYYNLYNLQVSMQTQGSFAIYDIGGSLRFSTNSIGEIQTYPIYWGIINKIRASNDIEFYAVDQILNSNSQVSKTIIQTGFPIENSIGINLGYTIMGLSSQSLNSLFEGSYSPKDTIVITDKYMNLIYSTNKEDADKIINQFNTNSFESSYSYSSLTEPYSNFNVLLRKPNALSNNAVRSMYQISLIIALACLILCILISLKIGKSLTKPISKLNNAMEQVKSGDLTMRISTNRQDELGNLTNNFNHMTIELKKYIDKQIEAEKKLNDTRLQLFQTQLNPHFLYNTLDSIRWCARTHEIVEIASMSENLATILRESISGSQLTTLRSELELVDNYIEIQKIRFNDCFSYEAEIPPQLENCIVPKLLLQPIVENAIIHGIADKDEGCVMVYADQVGSDIIINVTDDGVGMDLEILNWLNCENMQKRQGHFGLFNLNNIIKLYYGPRYGLKAIVEKGIGTTITGRLPISREVKNDYSSYC